MNKKKKIRNINISQIIKYYLPITGKISILHRITGILMVILIPIFLIFFQFILKNKKNFNKFIFLTHNIYIKIIFFFINEIFLYHIFSGFRYIIMDINLGIEKKSSKIFSYITIIISILLNFFLITNY
ncbi:succinate dehydrogenase, cytochrome b556 subunit [Candidatus Zinderia endosymbiont of Aphrophora alni]|uniref:succinate dehydrogenase, cytochrome b556 subunit n=1 Tax=Candidatus Zinderia endosymbiont of Aphrophora alni TaxID=3077951 RepID=UPI0030CBD629